MDLLFAGQVKTVLETRNMKKKKALEKVERIIKYPQKDLKKTIA